MSAKLKKKETECKYQQGTDPQAHPRKKNFALKKSVHALGCDFSTNEPYPKCILRLLKKFPAGQDNKQIHIAKITRTCQVWYVMNDETPSDKISELLPGIDEHDGLNQPVIEYDAPGDNSDAEE
jgi:hypothetical protein